MVVIAVGVFGVVSFTRLTTDLFPDVNIPFAVVITTYPGASPDEVESEVSVPLENTLQTTSNVIEVTSMSSENFSMIMLEFNPATNMDSALVELRENLELVRDSLPSDAGNPNIIRLNPDLLPIMTFSVTYEGKSLQELTEWVESDLRPQVERVSGVASLDISGAYEAEIRVSLDSEAIDDFNQLLEAMDFNDQVRAMYDAMGLGDYEDFVLDKAYIGDILMGQNFGFPAGFVSLEGIDYLVRVGDGVDSLDEMKDLTIIDLPFPGGTLMLSDVADVSFVAANEQRYSKVNNIDALTISIQKGSEFATTEVADGVNAVLREFMDTDDDFDVIMLIDQGEYINQSTGSVTTNLVLGGALAIVILLAFLRNFRVTFIVGIAIPISLLFAIVLIYLSGITLNIVSLGGLALGIGMLVDNSIVVMENIFRMKKEGATRKEAALYGTHQVAGAITASTLTTIGVFLPIMFIEDFIREIFYQLALTVTFSLLASLMIALTLVPALASRVMNETENGDKRFDKTPIFDRLKRGYEKVLKRLIKFRVIMITGVLLLFGVSIALATSRGFEFFPATDEGTLSISVEMDPDEPLNFEVFSSRLDDLYVDLRQYSDIDTIGISLGGGMMMFGGSSSDRANVNIVMRDDRVMSTGELRDEILDLLATDYEDLIFEVSGTQGDVSALTGSGIQIRLTGTDLEVMRNEAEKIVDLLESVEGLRDIDPGFGRETREVKITVDKDAAASYVDFVTFMDGRIKPLTVEGVWMMVAGQISGTQSVGTVRVDGSNYSLYVFEEGDTKQVELPSVNVIENFVVGFNPLTGDQVTLGEIASVEIVPGFSTITRIDGVRSLTISADFVSGFNATLVAADVEEVLEGYELPAGYDYQFLGENEEIMAAIQTLVLVGALAILLVYMIMASQFQSLVYPFIIMITIPLAFTGGFMILYIFGMPVSIVALIGLIVLAGVVVNNGIVLVDYINQLRARGLGLEEAMIEAGKVRMRPIFMTALTTILALLGLAIGFGEGAELMQPMALTAIGGLIYATFLTIFIVPLLYYSVTLRGRYIFGGIFAIVFVVIGAGLLIEGFLLYGIISSVLGLFMFVMMFFLPNAPIKIKGDASEKTETDLDDYMERMLK